MPQNDFLTFSAADSANALTPAQYAANGTRQQGVQAGTASSSLANTVWRQTSTIAAMIGLFINNAGGLDANDDGDVETLEASFEAAIKQIAVTPINSTQIVQAAGSPFNYRYSTSTLRTDASAQSAGLQVTVLSGLAYTKKSPTSNLVVSANFTSYAPVIPGQGNGASTVRLTTSTGPFGEASLNSVYNTTNGAPGGGGSNSPTFVIAGVPMGPLTMSLSFARGDALAWRTIFNPYPSDFNTTGGTPYSFYFIYEYEPGT